jgi:hypothetical protein
MTLGRGLRDATAGSTSDHARMFSFASLSPLVSDKTEVTRELDEDGPSPLSNADRAWPVGTPLRWERVVHREGRATVSCCIS